MTLSEQEFKAALPAKLKKSVSQDVMDVINHTLSEPEEFERYRDNLINYTHVLQDGKFKLSSYLDAVRYVTFKMAGLTNKAAYYRTFPDKIQRFEDNDVSDKDIASYYTAYNKSKLVTLIYGQTLTPTWIVNQDLYQKALNVQAELMMFARSEKVRCDAASSLLTQLKQPETQKVQLDVSVAEDKTIDALRASTMELVAQQRAMLEAGAVQAKDVAHSKLITDADYEEVE